MKEPTASTSGPGEPPLPHSIDPIGTSGQAKKLSWYRRVGKKPKEKPEWTWTQLLIMNENVRGVPVSGFPHVPLARFWKTNCPVGMLAEVAHPNPHGEGIDPDLKYWFVSVIDFCGYMAKVRYEGMGNFSSFDWWVHIKDLHHIGYAREHNYRLMAPLALSALPGSRLRSPNWTSYVKATFPGKISLPKDVLQLVKEQMQPLRSIRVGAFLELDSSGFDSQNASYVKVGQVVEVLRRRLRIKIANSSKRTSFWFHEFSPLIHNMGWCAKVGHSPSSKVGPKVQTEPVTEFLEALCQDPPDFSMKVGMMLQCVHPRHREKLVAATITKVLRHGYLMACALDEPDLDNRQEWFCYHIDSPLVMSTSFCGLLKYDLPRPFDAPPPPAGAKFDWAAYFKEKKASHLPIVRQTRFAEDAGFLPGLKLEAVDLVESHIIAPATVAQLCGHLVLIHFDGWTDKFDQWVDSFSPDLYPVGWSELVGFELVAPNGPPPAPPECVDGEIIILD